MQVAALGDGVSLEARLLSRFVPSVITHVSRIFIWSYYDMYFNAGRKEAALKQREVSFHVFRLQGFGVPIFYTVLLFCLAKI
jgi:hypothetical protein